MRITVTNILTDSRKRRIVVGIPQPAGARGEMTFFAPEGHVYLSAIAFVERYPWLVPILQLKVELTIAASGPARIVSSSGEEVAVGSPACFAHLKRMRKEHEKPKQKNAVPGSVSSLAGISASA